MKFTSLLLQVCYWNKNVLIHSSVINCQKRNDCRYFFPWNTSGLRNAEMQWWCFIKSVLLKILQNHRQTPVLEFIKNETQIQVFSCVLCDIFKNNFLKISWFGCLDKYTYFIHSYFPPKHFSFTSFIHILEED